MTDNYTNYRKRQVNDDNAFLNVAPLSKEEKEDLKMRILFAINTRMA